MLSRLVPQISNGNGKLSVIKAQMWIQDRFDKYRHDYCLPEDLADEIGKVGDRMLHAYAIAHNDAITVCEMMLFKILPKHHYYWHLLMRCRFHHPMIGCCLLDEDFVGRMKFVGASCARGTALHKIPEKVMEKWRWGRSSMLELDRPHSGWGHS